MLPPKGEDKDPSYYEANVLLREVKHRLTTTITCSPDPILIGGGGEVKGSFSAKQTVKKAAGF